jgi:Na+-driven multidrug efflux pump
VAIIGGAQFKPAGTVLALQGITLGAVFVSSVWGYGLFALGEYRTLLITNLLGLLTNVIVVIAFVKLFGVDGAAAGSSLVEVIYAFVSGWFLRRLRPGMTVAADPLLRVLVAGLGGLAPLALAPVGVPVIGRLVLSSLIYFGLLALLRAVPPELVAFARARTGQLRSRAG